MKTHDERIAGMEKKGRTKAELDLTKRKKQGRTNPGRLLYPGPCSATVLLPGYGWKSFLDCTGRLAF